MVDFKVIWNHWLTRLQTAGPMFSLLLFPSSMIPRSHTETWDWIVYKLVVLPGIWNSLGMSYQKRTKRIEPIKQLPSGNKSSVSYYLAVKKGSEFHGKVPL